MMDSHAVAMETEAATNQISISNTMTLDASQIDGNSIIAIDNDGNRIPIIIAPSDSKENGEIKMSDGESVPVVYVKNSEDKQGDEEVTENEFEAIVVEQSGDQDLANIQFNVYKTDNNSLVIQIPNDSITETGIEEQVIEESVQTTIDDIRVTAMSTTCECDICGEYFTNLKDHLTRHPDIETLYSCDTCGKLFSSSDRLTIHLNIHAGNIEDEVLTVEKEAETSSNNRLGDFVCDICHKAFTLSKYLQAHKLVHSEDKRFQCSICDKKFSQKRYLKAHEFLHKGIKPFTCSKCPKTFTNVTALNAHLNGHLGFKPYKCTICSKGFYRQSNLSAHTKRHSAQPVKVDYDNKIRCECNLSFQNEEELQAHVGMHTGPEPFKCTHCTAEYRLLCKLQDHAKIHMGSEKSYECQICGRAYRHKNSLRSHLASHAQQKLWKCNICDKRFSLQGNLRTHEKLHTGLKPYKCELCGKCFARIDHMRQHRKVHDGIRPYKCDICNKAFSRSHHYQAHINNIHNETKPHECQICHKRFGYVSNLRTHEKIHFSNKDQKKIFNKCRACGQTITFIKTETTVLQKKEFKCEDCGELYHCAQSLTIHQNTHKGDIPFRCNYCEKQFTNNKNLNKHLKIHSGARDYACHICDRTFIFGHHLKRHLMTHTGQSVKKEKKIRDEDESEMETEEKSDESEIEEQAELDNNSTDQFDEVADKEADGKSDDTVSKTKFTDVICLKPKTEMPDVSEDVSAEDENVSSSDSESTRSKGREKNEAKSSKKGQKVQNDDINGSDKNTKSMKTRQKDGNKKDNSKGILDSEKKKVSDQKNHSTRKLEVRVNNSKKDQIKCDACGKTFDTVSNVKRHKYAVHVKGESSTKSSKEESGKNVKRRTRSQGMAKKKLNLDSETDEDEEEDGTAEPPEGDGPHKCHICKKNFSCLGYLMQHLAKHAGDKPFQCDVCGKGFAMSTYLRKHRASHTSSIGTQATPPSSPDKSEITANQSSDTKPKISTLSRMQTRKRKLNTTPDINVDDAKEKDRTSVSISETAETENLECHICGLKVSASRYLKQHLKKHDKDDINGPPNKKSKYQNLDQDDKKLKNQNSDKDENTATPKTGSKNQNSEKDENTATPKTGSKNQNSEKYENTATPKTGSKNQNSEKDENTATPKTGTKNKKPVKKETAKPDKVKQTEQTKLDDIKSPKTNDVKSLIIREERSTRSKTVKIEGESKKVLYTSGGDDPLKCEVCGRQFHLPYNFMIHQKTHQVEEEKGYKCEECGSCFKRAYNLKKHKETHKKQKVVTKSNVKSDSKIIKVSPQKTATGRPRRVVTNRPKKSASSSHLKVSTFQSVKIETISLDEKMQLSQVCKCHTCGKQFADDASLKFHQAQHLTNTLKCDICPKTFFSESNLRKHKTLHMTGSKAEILSLKDEQSEALKNSRSPKVYECGICEKKFHTVSHLRIHVSTHTKNKVSRFTSENHFLKHQAVRKLKTKLTMSKPRDKVSLQGHTCLVCGVKIFGTYSYKRHLMIHTKFRKGLTAGNINNSSVGLVKKNRSHLVRPKHSGEPVQDQMSLNIMQKTPEISTLNKNKLVFQSPKSELKTYECHICKQLLSREFNLMRHMEQHHKLITTPEKTSVNSEDANNVKTASTEFNESEMQSHSNQNDTVLIVKHIDDNKDSSVKSVKEISSRGINLPEGSVITVTADESGEELYKVELNELCSETAESANIAVTKTTGMNQKTQTSLLSTKVLDEIALQNSKSKPSNETKKQPSNEINQSNSNLSSVSINSNANLTDDVDKSTVPEKEETIK